MLLAWHSLDSVRRIHDIAEVIGVILFALLVLAEAIQIVYGRRERFLAAGVANRQVETLQTWHMSQEERATLTVALSPFRNQKVSSIFCITDSRSSEYANDLLDLLIGLHWDLGPNPNVEPIVFQRREDASIEVLVNDAQLANRTYPPVANVLVGALFKLRLTKRYALYRHRSIPADTIGILVGTPIPNR